LGDWDEMEREADRIVPIIKLKSTGKEITTFVRAMVTYSNTHHYNTTTHHYNTTHRLW